MPIEVNLEVKVVEGYRGKPSVYLEIDMAETGAVVSLESRGIAELADIKEFLEDIARMILPEEKPKQAAPFAPQAIGGKQ